MSSTRLTHFKTLHPISLASILISSIHLRLYLSNSLLPSDFLTNNIYAFLFFILLDHSTYTWRRVLVTEFFIMQFFPLPLHFIPLRPKYSPQRPVLAPLVFVPPSCQKPPFAPHPLYSNTYGTTFTFIMFMSLPAVHSRTSLLSQRYLTSENEKENA
jgi:hypothetical protein